LGVLGGSGLYDIPGLERIERRRIEGPWGPPSDELMFGEIEGVKLVFLPRHGRGHRLSPTSVNARANIDALKRAGCTDILSLSAVGSLREDLSPGTFVLVDQYIDRTFAREKSFFASGLVAHVGMGHPACGRLGDHLQKAMAGLNLAHQRGGTYLVMEGPQFSTQAESNLYRSWGCDVIGMTNMPEAKLAREAEICYATVAMVTDYDCWHPGHDHVTVDSIVATLHANADNARALIKAATPLIARDHGPCAKGCNHALDYALITAPEARDPKMIAKLDAVAGRVLK
jgi:5'-methylthioadenosine phosphorylase